MLAFLQDQLSRVAEQPVDALLKTAIKAVVLVSLLVTAAQWAQSRSMDRTKLAKLSGASVKEPLRTGFVKK
jgi:hypothetical protein